MDVAPLIPHTPTGDLFLHRFAVKPHHTASYLPLWRREVAAQARHGFIFHRAFLETDAEPKLTWLYSHPDPDAGAAALAADPETTELDAAKAPHVFRNTLVRRVECERLTGGSTAAIGRRIAIMRRYRIVGGWDDFLTIWRRVAQVRERYGFRCLFAVIDRDDHLFTWAFDFDGTWPDFPAAQRDYYHDPERVELRGVFDFMADYSIHPADQLLP